MSDRFRMPESPPGTSPGTSTAAAATSHGISADTVWESAAHRRTVYGVLAVVAMAILFDGYDLVVYGAILPTLMADPTQIGELGAAQAGALGSYALVGVMIGALTLAVPRSPVRDEPAPKVEPAPALEFEPVSGGPGRL